MLNDVIREIENIDWNFKRYRQRGIDNVHWFPANFIPQIPSILVANLSDPKSIILDPFCGSGTTVIEAAKLGRIGIGVDINPLASLIAKVKITYINPSKLESLFNKFEYLLAETGKTPMIIPDFPNKDRWFHKDTLRELGYIFYLINLETEKKVKDLLFIIFSAILKKCCTQRDHYTYVADNMFPKGDDPILRIDAKYVFLAQLRKMVNAVSGFYQDIEIQGNDPQKILAKCRIYEEDTRLLTSIKDEVIDLIVTSPPYANVTDYTTGNRLSFYWLNLGDFENSKKEEIGARWKRLRKRALEDYIIDMQKCFLQFRRVLKEGGHLCCVLGETSSVRKQINLNDRLLHILKQELGFEILSKCIERNIYAKRIRAVRGVNKEHIFVLKKST